MVYKQENGLIDPPHMIPKFQNKSCRFHRNLRAIHHKYTRQPRIVHAGLSPLSLYVVKIAKLMKENERNVQ